MFCASGDNRLSIKTTVSKGTCGNVSFFFVEEEIVTNVPDTDNDEWDLTSSPPSKVPQGLLGFCLAYELSCSYTKGHRRVYRFASSATITHRRALLDPRAVFLLQVLSSLGFLTAVILTRS